LPPAPTSTPPTTPDLYRCTLRPARALRQRCAAPSPRRAAAAPLLHGCVRMRAPRAALTPAAALQAKCLCENGADVNAQSGFDDSTALHRVVSSVSQRAVCAASHLRPSVSQPRGDIRARVGTERAPTGRGGAQRLPRGARGCRRRPQRQVASCRDCALRLLAPARCFLTLACPCVPMRPPRG